MSINAMAFITDAEPDPTLPTFIPESILGTPIFDYAAEALAAGALATWDDLDWAGDGAIQLVQASSGSRPAAGLDANGLPVVSFDGTNDNMSKTGLALGSAITVYIVFRADAVGTSARTILNLSGANLTINTSSKLALNGTGGNLASTGSLVAGTLYAAAFVLGGTSGASALDIFAEHVTGTTTFNALSTIQVGTTGTQWFDGDLVRCFAIGAAHTQGQRAAQLAALRDWYGAS